MNIQLTTILKGILIIFLIAIGLVVINEGAKIMADLSGFIAGLFQEANFSSNRGKNSAFKLVLISVFVGWAIYRFRNMKR